MKKIWKSLLLVVSGIILVACGGGGGDPGNSSGGGTVVNNGSLTVQTYGVTNGKEVAINSFSSSDLTIHAKATLKDRSGSVIRNEIVTFSEDGAGLLTFLPESATALTNDAGVAEVDLRAADLTKLGATKLVVKAVVQDRSGADVTLQGTQNLSVGAPIVPDPQQAASAIAFKESIPADQSIVIKGAGGNGRSETAQLTFAVQDGQGVPLKGVIVDFVAVPADSVDLNVSSGVSDSAGLVTATVNSKSTPTSVIVRATVRNRNISTQSDTLTVTTGIATQRGFDLAASKFNMDTDLSGDSSVITVRIIDSSGNPVADGVPVVAQADYGSIGSSSRGGCTTANGSCTVNFVVQNPRPDDGVPAKVVFSTQTGQNTPISGSLQLWLTSVSWLNFYTTYNAASPFSGIIGLSVTDPKACKFGGFEFFLGTPKGFAAPAGTVISVRSRNGNSTPSIVAGSPTLDRAATRTLVEFAAAGNAELPDGEDVWVVQFVAGPSQTVKTINLRVSVPNGSCEKKDG